MQFIKKAVTAGILYFKATQTATPSAQAPVSAAQSVQTPVNATRPVHAPINVAPSAQAPVNTSRPVQAPINATRPVQAPVNTTRPVQAPVNVAPSAQAPVNATRPVQAPINVARFAQAPVNVAPFAHTTVNAARSAQALVNTTPSANATVNALPSTRSKIRISKQKPISQFDHSLLTALAADFMNIPNDSRFEIIEQLSKKFSRRQLRKFGFKFCNTAFTSKDAIIAKRKRQAFDVPLPKKRKGEDQVMTFLHTHSTPGANATKNIGQEAVPVRLLNDNISAMYSLFCAENDNIISEATFRRIIPKNFKYSSKATDLCAECEQGKKLSSTYNQDLNKLEEQYAAAKTEKRKHALQKQITDLKFRFSEYNKHKKHKDIQRQAFREDKQNINASTLLLVLDFKENIHLRCGPREISTDFYEREARTIFGIVAYYRLNNDIVKQHWDVVSSILNHDSKFVLDSLKLVLHKKQQLVQKFQKLVVWTDGGPHFCSNETAATLLQTLPSLHNNFTSVTWNRFAPYHGKSPCDSHFSILSRWLSRISRHTKIDSTATLIQQWSNCAKQSAGVAAQFFELRQEDFTRSTVHQLMVRHIKTFFKLQWTKRNNRFTKALNSKATSKQQQFKINNKNNIDKRTTKAAYSKKKASTTTAKTTVQESTVDDDNDEVVIVSASSVQ